MKGLLVTVAAAVLGLVAVEQAVGHAAWKHEPGSLAAPLVHEIEFYRGETWDLQDAMGEARTPTVYAERRSESEAFREWIRDLWKGRLEQAEKRYAKWKENAASASSGWGVWQALAECESGGDWGYNGSSGFDGGLQFLPSTWSSHAPPGYPAYAWQASPAQQIAVAELVLESSGWGAWPACSAMLGLG
jgi:Transglycosylase-like domain